MSVKTTYFNKKNGGLSSIRTTIGNSSNKMSITTYPSTDRGGVTFKNDSTTMRMNNTGTSIGIGLSCGNNTTYFGSCGNVVSDLPSY